MTCETSPGELHAAPAVLRHQLGPRFERQQVPVLVARAHLAHRVEAEARPVGKLGKEPLPVHRPQPLGIGGDLGLEHAALGIEALALAEDPCVLLGVGHVLGNLGDRVERIGRHERRAQARGLDGHLDVVDGLEVRARP